VIAPGVLRGSAQPVLRSAAGLTLRPWRPGDVPAVVAAYADPDIQRWNLQSLDEAEAASWIAQWPQHWQAETDACWAVTSGTGEILGRVAVRTISLADGFGQVTYWVLPGARGRGVAAQATAEVARWALDDVGLHRLELVHSLANPASCRVAEKAGFAVEGVLREGMLHQDGWHDMHLHARTAGRT
jgi:RimJ/RimL family protein N-acetyltransferase